MVSFSNFGALDPEMADTTRELIDDAYNQKSPFQPFMNTWMAFNGWMESVTERNSDSEMITALADNRRLSESFDAVLNSNNQFRRRVTRFAHMWPILSVRDVRRKLGNDAFWSMDRDHLLAECQRQDVRMQPIGWTEGELPTWPQLLRTIYMMRCNLFHGSKSPQNGRDRELVGHADWVLRAFILESGCFDWHD